MPLPPATCRSSCYSTQLAAGLLLAIRPLRLVVWEFLADLTSGFLDCTAAICMAFDRLVLSCLLTLYTAVMSFEILFPFWLSGV